MVIVCQFHGLSAQQAFDTVGKLLEDCYRRWEVVEASVPRWGAEVDAEVQRYIDGIKAVVKANLNWRQVLFPIKGHKLRSKNWLTGQQSFKTARYLGPAAAEIKLTRRLQIPVESHDYNTLVK